MTEKYQPIPHRLKNMAVGGHVAGAEDIDAGNGKTQQDINADTYRKNETYSKEQLNNMITTPEQEYLSVTATSETTDVDDIATLIATKYPDGKESADTVYRVGCWDGEQYNTNTYAEYVWDGTQYILGDVKNPGIDSEPTAESSNLIESGAVFSLSAELGNPVKSLSGSHTATSSEEQYIEIPGIKNGKSYIVNASATVSSPTSMCWQIYGYNGSSYTALWGALPTSSKRFDTFSGGVEYTYLKYYLRIVQDVSDSDFVIKDYGNIKDELSRIEGIAQNNKGKIEDVEESLSGVVIETVVGPLEANTQKYIDGIENGKDYRVITQMSVATPTSMSFQIYGYKNGAATALFGATANQEKMLKTYNNDGAYDYDRYFYKISQEMSGGKVVIVSDFWQSGIDAVAADVDGLKKTVYKKTFEVEQDFDAYTYLPVPMEAGKTYRYVSDLDDTHEGEAVTQIYCKINDSWTLKYGFLAKTDRKITIPSDSTGVQIYVRFECSGSILVENVNSIEYRVDEMSDENNIIITANSDPNSSADFTGNTAIQDAIDSITDASPGKVYTIQATGEFIADSISDYQAQRTQYVFIRGKNYINIDGVSKNSCIIRCSLPDTVAENKLVDNNFSASDYALFQPLWWDFNGKIKNVKIIARNIRYPLHVDSSTTTLQENTTIDIENCDLIHEGKYGDAVGSIGGNAVGFAVSQGMTLNLKGCKFEDAYGAPYGHDNVNHKVSGTINYIDCEFIHNAPAFNNAKPSIHFECLSKYGVSSIMNVIGCLIPEGTRYYGYMSNLDTIKRNADSICNIVNVDSYPVPQDSAAVSTIALMIKSNSTSSPSSVRVDPTSTAFDDIFGYSKETAFQMNTRTCRRRQYGYEYKDGGNGLQGIAIGTVNVSQALVDGKYINYLGKRLGDCSETNKTLTVIVDGVSHDIVFDKDYNGTADNVAPNYSNSDIIAEMNTALSGYAVVSTYSIDNDWMPNFLKGVEVRFNKDNVFIEAGMAVVYEESGVRKAKRTDGRIDGIALDSAAVNDNLRIITGGSIAYQGVRYSIKKASGSPDISTLSYGTKLSISQTDGVFEVSESVPVCMIGEGNAVIIYSK